VRERVARTGGTVNVESLTGRGTRLTVELPVAVAERDSESVGAEPSPAAAVKA
jgi:chemotaxis protein histidine kinase CheA